MPCGIERKTRCDRIDGMKTKKLVRKTWYSIFKIILCVALILLIAQEGMMIRDTLARIEEENRSHYADLGVSFYDPVEEVMAQMTDREKVGQLFIVNPAHLNVNENGGIYYTGVKYIDDHMREVYDKYPCGGFTITYNNIAGLEQFQEFTDQMHSLGSGLVRPWICCDEEGGSVVRLGAMGCFDVPVYPSMQYIAENESLDYAYDMGKSIGEYMVRYGLDLNFAPIADVNSNPRNPVIGRRAFGSDPVIAAEYVASVTRGMRDGGVLTTLKHFPGHGDTANDTHSSAAVTYKTWDELMECEMLPFIAGIEAGTDCIMTAHIKAPNVTGDDIIACFSYEMMTEKLRNELGFDGLIMTDGLEMRAVTNDYSSEEACVMAIQAGCDILLMPGNYIKGFEGVMQAIEDGTITMDRIEESVYRILKIKLGYERHQSDLKNMFKHGR